MSALGCLKTWNANALKNLSMNFKGYHKIRFASKKPLIHLLEKVINLYKSNKLSHLLAKLYQLEESQSLDPKFRVEE